MPGRFSILLLLTRSSVQKLGLAPFEPRTVAPAMSPPSFFTPVILPENISPLVIQCRTLSYGVHSFLVRVSTHCPVCYFLGRPLPVLTKRIRAYGDSTEVINFHHGQPTLCPYRLVHPSTPFFDFSREVYSSLRRSDSGGDGIGVCDRCADPYALVEGHDVCIYGQALFVLAFLVWEDRPTRDRVFTYISSSASVLVPDLQSREAYAEWLGFSIRSRPSLNHIHLVAVAYHALRRARLLPRPEAPIVETSSS
ncbi:hypothetical protein OG21DRAFT_627770 [Imleria badia]|nr:hypothetical protein OG21DRAFT_627770 [Imleria badia]